MGRSSKTLRTRRLRFQNITEKLVWKMGEIQV